MREGRWGRSERWDGPRGCGCAAFARTALQHEVRDDAVELGARVVEVLARRAHALLARAQRAEILDRLGHRLAVQAHHDAASGRAINLNIKEDLRRDLRVLRLHRRECEARN